jgi:hypothetical protein
LDAAYSYPATHRERERERGRSLWPWKRDTTDGILELNGDENRNKPQKKGAIKDTEISLNFCCCIV